jgi:hypothetical protein
MRRCLIPCLLLTLVIMAACNLQPISAPTPTPYPTPFPVNAAGTQVIYVTATPFALSPGSNAPAGSIPAQSNDVANWILNNVIVPAWNFLYEIGFSLVATLWAYAGERGGLMAQVGCCILPAALTVVWVIRYFFYGRRWRIW